MIDGDMLKFPPRFGDCIVTPVGPCLIGGSGEACITNKKICVLGDEKKVSIAATYTRPPYTTPGTGNITITALAADQQTGFATAITAIIVVGRQFVACFTPTSAAIDPQGVPDSALSPVSGAGSFVNSQSFVTAG
ncbi:hypothetical protein [Serratia sp. CY76391]|uniref:hypothetical protein n=1 Tax=Serratia sp. CY76391 TaxID=3383681 RepID=UPI003FA0AE60